ncbi:hypothetical protein [Pseudomonas guariconensis]|uniref:hypothetical protein n=1 Tax=Pseudomonas guariconensis TaxID=1288410 RepID=UPI003906C711
MNKLLGFALLALASTVNAFEIRPIGLNGGAYNARANGETIRYLDDKYASRCTKAWYLHNLDTEPVHEIITRIAYPSVYGANGKLRAQTWRSPLLAGVEWNDDPEQLLRRAVYYDGRKNIQKFWENEGDASRPNTLTRRTHHGDLQFLHAMRESSQTSEEAKARLLRWLKFTYEIAIGNVPSNEIRKTSPYHEFFGKVGCSKNPQLPNPSDCTVMDVLDIHRLHRDGDLKANLQQLATGAIAHVIQDSYSSSHTQREAGGLGRLVQFYTYDEKNRETHCESDGMYKKNEPNIEMAIAQTANLLWHIKTKKTWEQAEPFFNSVFAFRPLPGTK